MSHPNKIVTWRFSRGIESESRVVLQIHVLPVSDVGQVHGECHWKISATEVLYTRVAKSLLY
jgi:hypothetical protein